MQTTETFNPMLANLPELLEHTEQAADCVEARTFPDATCDLVDVLADDFHTLGESRKGARLKACRIVTILAHYWGGRAVYLPKNDRLRVALRNKLIWLSFCDHGNQQTVSDAASKHGLSVQMVYNIIDKQRKQARNKNNRVKSGLNE